MIDGPDSIQWPEGLRGRLAQFRQGSLVRRPPRAYHADTTRGVWIASRLASQPGSDELIELAEEDRPRFGMIVTPTCDIEGPGAHRKPWVQVAPVYELAETDPRLGQVRSWSVTYLVPVTALGPRWVADLRIEMPVEKSWLAGSTHQEAFVEVQDYVQLGEYLANQRGRPGLGDHVYEELLNVLRARLAELGRRRADLYDEFATNVTHVAVDVRGDVLAPEVVQVIFVSALALSEDLNTELEDWWAAVTAANHQFDIASSRYLTDEESIPLRDQLRWTWLPRSFCLS